MALSVKHLRDRLADRPDHLHVVLAKEREGNRFSGLDALEAGNVDHTEGWEWGLIAAAESEEDADPAALEINAVCLWPLNARSASHG